jgi:HD-like signal output (HDOD) protein
MAKNKEDFQTSRSGKTNHIIDEIVLVLKRGEINLPSLPQMGVKFKEMFDNSANIQQIASLLKQDVALCAKLIGISNSAFYRGAAENKTLEQAVSRLGLSTTGQYVYAITNRSIYYNKNKNFKGLLEKLWQHSLSCAYASQIVCKTLAFKLKEDSFTLGLLHDIGRLVLLQAVGELQLKQKLPEEIDNKELSNTMDANHGKFGAALLKRWGFSNEYIQISVYHDQLEEADFVSNGLLVVHFANLLVKSMGYNLSGNGEIDLENTNSAKMLKLDTQKIANIKDLVKVHMEELKGFIA